MKAWQWLVVGLILLIGAVSGIIWFASRPEPVGAVLVYEIEGEADAELTEQVAKALAARFPPQPWGKPVVRTRALEPGRVAVDVFGDDPDRLNRVKHVAMVSGTLEFRILANWRDHQELIEIALEMPLEEKTLEIGGEPKARWVPVDPKEEDQPAMQTILTDPELVDRSNRNGLAEVLVVIGVFDVTGADVADARPGMDERGRPTVQFTLTDRGAKLFGALTADNLPDPATEFRRHLGIILNGTLKSAPTINTVIYHRGEIAGDFTQEEVDRIVGILNVGTLPAPIRLVEETITRPER